MIRVGVLHTVPALVPVFDQLLSARRDDIDIVHIADASLLSRAIAHGVTDDVRASLRDHLTAMRAAGAETVLVTCSSIGEAAVEAAQAVDVRVMRVDAAMAAEAVDRATTGDGRVLVLATLAATLGPTTRLVEAAAAEASGAVTIEALVVEGAASARSTGDLEKHDALIAAAIAEAGDVDAIVLAQASMASGAGSDRRVLTSPESGAAAFVEALRR